MSTSSSLGARFALAFVGALLVSRHVSGEGIALPAGTPPDTILGITAEGGFDGDLRICFNKGTITAESLPSWEDGAALRLSLEIETAGGKKKHEINGMGTHNVPGDWALVFATGAPVMNQWQRASGKGNAPDFRTVSATCADWIDGPGGRPGPVTFKIFWPIETSVMSAGAMAAPSKAQPQGLPDKARVAITYDDSVTADAPKSGAGIDPMSTGASTLVREGGRGARAYEPEVVRLPSLKELNQRMEQLKPK